MAPEQARGQLDLLDGRADVWSLGALLFELLTLERAWQADDVWVLMHLAATADPPDPRERSPHRGVADEIAEICLRAMASEPDERFAGAAELAGAVQDFLEGSRRRERAARHLQEAERLREAWRGVAGVRVGLERRLEELESTVPAWAPLEDKAELFAVRARLEGLPAERAGLFADHVAAAERALAQDPDSEQARSVLAQAWFVRLEEAEEARRSEERILCEGQLERYDDGAFRARLRAGGRLSLATDPEGAEALLQRFDRRPLVWSFGPPRSLGRTPLRDVELSPGSYLLTLRAPGCRDTRYPVLIERGERWHAGELPVPLYSDAEIGPGQLYVPRGTCLIGGDPELGRDQRPRSRAWVEGAFIARFPATMGEYCVFINDVATRDIDEAWARVPRQLGGLARGGGQMWERPAAGEPFVLPEVDREGDPWDERQPLMGISWQEAWRAERDGLAWQLPGEALWEKAARGVDGRLYPWGDRFDASLCKTQVSREHHSHPESVDLFPGDVSVYGVRTLAGCILEWVAEAHADGDVGARVWRGGSWHRPPRSSRAASRERVSLRGAIGFVGLRLARPAPRG
jgi:serine/threonine-protein kinase